MRESEGFIRLIVRRPEAYQVRKKFPIAQIPGLLFLDADGKATGAIGLDQKTRVADLVAALRKHAEVGAAPVDGREETVAIRVDGMVKSQGIT